MNSIIENQQQYAVSGLPDPEVELKNWPKTSTYIPKFICSASQPMPQWCKEFSRSQIPYQVRLYWEHSDFAETDADSDSYIEYRCKNCGYIWRTEMPD